MVIVKLIGGLGNQMFQYAFAYAFSQKAHTQFKLDISAFESYDLRQYELDCFCILEEIATAKEICQLKYKDESFFRKTIRKITRQPQPFADTYYSEKTLLFDNDVFSKRGSYYLDGYWQSQRYFQDYREDLLRLLTLKENFHTKSQQYQQQILNSQSVSIHIRRGDYIANPKTDSIHGTCSISYYKKSISFITKKIKHPHFFIFSDDLIWAKDNLFINEPFTFVELDRDASDCEEMFLMSHCKYNIIANSSFSWWGAWLNQNPNKIVIAPQYWFRDTSIKTDDLIPESWIRI